MIGPRFSPVTLPHLDVAVPGADGSQQILDLVLVFPGLTGPVCQHFLEEAVLQVEADLQFLQDIAWSGLDLSEQGAAQVLEGTQSRQRPKSM